MAKKSAKKRDKSDPWVSAPLSAIKKSIDNKQAAAAANAPPVKKEDGGPAFPLSRSQQSIDFKWGMSLRDYFAAKAMASIVENWRTMHEADEDGNSEIWPSIGDINAKNAAAKAYKIADAMLAARKA